MRERILCLKIQRRTLPIPRKRAALAFLSKNRRFYLKKEGLPEYPYCGSPI
jgi:hypothetical protein